MEAGGVFRKQCVRIAFGADGEEMNLSKLEG